MASTGIFVGKVDTYAAHYAPVRVNASETTPGRLAAVQVALNDLYRLITGYRRSDKISIEELKKASGLPSLNEMAARESLSILWQSYKDPSAPLADIVSDLKPSPSSRSATLCKLNAPDPANTLLSSAVRLWNMHSMDLAAIKTKHSLKNYVEQKIWPSLPI